jgi:hypothetical protein
VYKKIAIWVLGCIAALLALKLILNSQNTLIVKCIEQQETIEHLRQIVTEQNKGLLEQEKRITDILLEALMYKNLYENELNKQKLYLAL